MAWTRRLANLGQAALLLLAFDVVLVLLWVKFIYATQLGTWSLEHYGAFGRNGWGLAKHVADLPIKLALPFALWAGFYLRRLLPARDDDGAAEDAHPAPRAAGRWMSRTVAKVSASAARLVRPVALDAGEAQGEAAGVLRARPGRR